MAENGEEVELTFCQKVGNGCREFGHFLYNSETGLVLGRSGKSWVRIGLFYLIFYGFLAGFFSAMLVVFLSTVNDPGDGGPKLTQFIKNKPGVVRIGSKTLLKGFDKDDETKASDFINQTKALFEVFESDIYSNKTCNISDTKGIPAGEKPCIIDYSQYGPCSPRKPGGTFGYKENRPCVFLKLNRVYGWVPESSNDGDYLEVKCGDHKVHPAGFALAAFPYRGNRKHHLPYVAVEIVATSSNVRIDCKLVGKDIEVSESFNKLRVFGKVRIEDVYTV